MSDANEDLTARLDAHLERRRRFDEELERANTDAERIAEAGGPRPWWMRASTVSESDASSSGLAEAGRPAVTIIVPIHNAPDELAECIHSLARHTTYPARILLIDDASTDPRIGELLQMASVFGGVQVRRNVENMGFTATVNRGLRLSSGDVVILNSDTAVGPRWLEQLVTSAYSAPDIGTVTPVSDNAGAFSVPVPNEPNPVPLSLSFADAARLLAQHGSSERPSTPTGSGFCLYVKRAVIDAIGVFDAEAFPRGYGEENDFSMRASHAGWRHVVDGRTFVHHEREASFGEEKRALLAEGRARLDELHPDYTAKAREFVSGTAMDDVRAKAQQAFAQASGPVRPRLLFVIHEGGGGAIATNLDLMLSLAPEWDCFVFSSDRWTMRLGNVIEGEIQTLREWPLEKAILLAHFSRLEYREAFAESLDRVNPELVHVRHVFKHTLDAPKMVAARAIPIVMSIHDYYTICPTIQLVDNNGRFCGGPCSPGHGVCPTLVKAGRIPHLKHAFVYQWRDEMDAALRCVDAFVTTSEQAREIHRVMHPAMRSARFELIEHGRNLTQASGLAEAPVPGGKVRILIPGNFDRHKGAELIEQMRELDSDQRLELHFLGEVPERYSHLGVMHGPYERSTFNSHVERIRPAFIGIFSVWAETYNHVLTEAWAAGVPALVTDIGSPAERVRAHGGGFVVPVDDPAAALDAVLAAADDRERYLEEAAHANVRGISTVEQMTERYADLYRDTINRRRTIVTPTEIREAPFGRGIWRMTAVVPGRFPSAQVRILRRYHHPEVEWKLRTRMRTYPSDLALDDADLVLVQRTAIPTADVATFVEELRARGLPLVVDLDDHLLDSDYGDAEQFATQLESMRVLLDAASIVTVSTPTLADTISELCRRVEVLPNQLDERLFLTGAGASPPCGSPPDPPRAIRVVYAASPSHADDLSFLREVFERLEREYPGRFELDVVGGERPTSEQPWYRRREIPQGHTDYPHYVALLREWRPGWDIAVAPLLDTRFNRHKSDLKFLEYSALGLPGVYSAVDAYSSVQDGVTGLRVPNDVTAWCDALRELAEDSERCDALRQAAWSEVTGERLLRQHAASLLDLIGRIIGDGPAVRRPEAVPIEPPLADTLA